MRTRYLSVVVFVLIAGASTHADALLILRDLTVDLEADGRITAFPDGSQDWRGTVPVEPFALATGDTLILTLSFDNDKFLVLTDETGGDELSTLRTCRDVMSSVCGDQRP